MKKMILIIAAFGFLMSCSKDIVQPNYLPGTWNLIKTELYENGALTASNVQEEINTVYYFSSCETSHSSICDMYIQEDGEQQFYSYSYDETTNYIQLNTSSNFYVEQISSGSLLLVRSYDSYESKYFFVKGD